MNKLILVYITNPSKEEAGKIAKHLIGKKLIACANIYDNVASIYPWEGSLVEEKEAILIAKSVPEKFEAIKEEVKKIHSYTTPCIIKIPVEPNNEYSDWVKSLVG